MYESFYAPQTTKGEVPGNCSQNWCCRLFKKFSRVSVSVLFFCQWVIHPERPPLLYLCPHLHLSNENKHWLCRVYRGLYGDYTIQLGGDYNKPWHYKDPYIKQPICHGNSDRFFLFFPVAQVLQEINEEVRRNHGYTPSEVEALTQTFRALDHGFFYGERGDRLVGKDMIDMLVGWSRSWIVYRYDDMIRYMMFVTHC